MTLAVLAVLAHRHRTKKGELHPAAMPQNPTATTHHETASTTRAETTPPPRRRIRLTLAEARRLFSVRDQAKHNVHATMNWSIFRREHQAKAAGTFTRRLKVQYLALRYQPTRITPERLDFPAAAGERGIQKANESPGHRGGTTLCAE
jgi:hypothetical protein